MKYQQKNFFNFERFYETLFFDQFSNVKPDFSTHYFKERFRNIMQYKSTFSKAQRTTFTANKFPGPEKYDPNLYDITFYPDLNQAYRGKKRYWKKTFVNKTGPVFSHKKQEKESKKQNIEKNDDDNSIKVDIKPLPQEYFQKNKQQLYWIYLWS